MLGGAYCISCSYALPVRDVWDPVLSPNAYMSLRRLRAWCLCTSSGLALADDQDWSFHAGGKQLYCWAI